MNTSVYNQDGKQVKDLELSQEIFGLPWNEDLVHQVVVSMQANKRNPWAHTKNRGEVAGSGIKPWRQKGSGRARHGSKQSPIWVGGGVTHGPRNEKDYSKKINKKMKRKALFTILSRKLKENEILFLSKVVLSQPKTKEAAGIFKSLSKIENFEKLATKRKNKAILVLPHKDEKASKSFRNIPGLSVLDVKNLNALDLLTYKFLVFVDPETSISAIK